MEAMAIVGVVFSILLTAQLGLSLQHERRLSNMEGRLNGSLNRMVEAVQELKGVSDTLQSRCPLFHNNPDIGHIKRG